MMSNQDLYKILGVSRDASPLDIKKAYLSKAKEFHPDRHLDKGFATNMFNQVSHAYEILSNDFTRSVYQNLSVQNTSSFLHNGNGDFTFKTTSTDGNTYFHSQTTTVKMKSKPIQRVFECLLEDLYFSKTKRIMIKKKVRVNGVIQEIERVLSFTLTPNLGEGSQVCFQNEGDESNTQCIPSDVIFVLKFLPHNVFQIRQHDLITFYEIIHLHRVENVDIYIETIDKRCLKVSLHGTISPGDETVVQGEGLPSFKGRGNLIIKFL